MTVKEAAIKAYNEMPEQFSGLQLVQKARLLCGRPYAYEDTFFRSLRDYRLAGDINYECTDHVNSQYKKVPKYEDKLQLSLFDI